jgi:hypothetical protein
VLFAGDATIPRVEQDRAVSRRQLNALIGGAFRRTERCIDGCRRAQAFTLDVTLHRCGAPNESGASQLLARQIHVLRREHPALVLLQPAVAER